MTNKPAIEGGRPVRDTFLPFARPTITEREIGEVVRTLESGWLATGPRTRQFEEAFAQYIGNRFAVGVTSGTAALALALEVAGIGAGDEVVTTPLTFAATAHQVLLRGAVPVFADIERRTFNIDPDRIEEAMTERTRAILVVHFAGRPCAMDVIQRIADKRGIAVISDSAHAIEALFRGRKLAETAGISAFSFHPNKNMTTGEGGMVATDREDWAKELRLLSFHGIDRAARLGGDVIRLGNKYNMSDLQAAIGLHQLAALEQNHAARTRLFGLYQSAFVGARGIIPPPPPAASDRHALHMYNILVDIDHLGVTRDGFCEALKAENVGAGVHYSSLHQMTYYRERFGFKRDDFPNSAHVSDRILTLPLYPSMTDADAGTVVEAVLKLAAFYWHD